MRMLPAPNTAQEESPPERLMKEVSQSTNALDFIDTWAPPPEYFFSRVSEVNTIMELVAQSLLSNICQQDANAKFPSIQRLKSHPIVRDREALLGVLEEARTQKVWLTVHGAEMGPDFIEKTMEFVERKLLRLVK